MNAYVNVVFFYIMWIGLHYGASHLYTYVCTPWTLQGFFMSPFVAPGPHCVALRWAVNTGGDTINLMWFALGTTALTHLTLKK